MIKLRFALIDGNRVEARSGLKGSCPVCSKPVTAKCGEQRVHHWAHLTDKKCDNWWENQTEWHRSWKNNFPVEWQEVILKDEQTGEKHIADVRTDNGLVIEFQHSSLDQQERITRENFYGNMVWIVDGMRLKRDYSRFVKAKNFFCPDEPSIFHVVCPEVWFHVNWLKSTMPVVFDFGSNDSRDSIKDRVDHLYCLFPMVGRHAKVAKISRQAFIKSTINGKWSMRVRNYLKELSQSNKELQTQAMQKLEDIKNFGKTSKSS